MCQCGLGEDMHWYVDTTVGQDLWQIGSSPEQAEHSLRTWAGKVVRMGHLYLDIRAVAGRILSTRTLNMIRLCDDPTLLAQLRDSCTID